MASPERYSMVTWDGLEPVATKGGGVLKKLGSVLGFRHMAMSVGRFGPGEGVEHHRHEKAEEFYYLMKGKSQVRIDDKVLEVEENTGFRFAPETMRSVFNASDEDCWWVFVGAPADEFLEEGSENAISSTS